MQLVKRAFIWTTKLIVLSWFVKEAAIMIKYYVGRPKLTLIETGKLPHSEHSNFTVCVSNSLPCKDDFAGEDDESAKTCVNMETEKKMLALMAELYSNPRNELAELPAQAAIFEADPDADVLEVGQAWLFKYLAYDNVYDARDEIVGRLLNETWLRHYIVNASGIPDNREPTNHRFGRFNRGMKDSYDKEIPPLCADIQSTKFDDGSIGLGVKTIRHESSWGGNRNRVWISPLMGPHTELNERSLVKLSHPRGDSARKHEIEARLRLHKIKRIGNCLPTPPDTVPSADMAEQLCNWKCEEQAHGDVLNCSIHGFLSPEWNVRKLNPCLYVPESAKDEIGEKFQGCNETETCNTRRYCEGYYFDYSFESETFGQIKLTKTIVYTFIYLNFDSAALVTESEAMAMDDFILFASIGGLVGIFLGGSLFGLIDLAGEMMEAAYKKKRKQQSQDK